MRYPAPAIVVTCLPCFYREGVLPGRAYPHACPNCGGTLEHYETTIDSKAEWRDLNRPGNRTRVERPRLVIGAPA